MNLKLRMQLATIMIALVIGSNSWAQTTVTGSLDASKISYVAADATLKSFVGQAYADVPDMVVYFDVAEGQAVKVDFSASIASQSEDPLLLRMVFDENPSLLIAPSKITIRPKDRLNHYSVTSFAARKWSRSRRTQCTNPMAEFRWRKRCLGASHACGST